MERFPLITTIPDAVTIDEDAIHNTVPIDCVTRAPDRTNAREEANKASAQKKTCDPSPRTRQSRNDGTDEAEYPVEQVHQAYQNRS